MTELRAYEIPLPVPEWRAEEHSPHMAREAVELADQLRPGSVSTDLISFAVQAPVAPDAFQVSTTMRHISTTSSMIGRLEVSMHLLDADGDWLGRVRAEVWVEWERSDEEVHFDPEVLDTFVRTIGYVDLHGSAVASLKELLRPFGIDALFNDPDQVSRNIREVHRVAGEPSMSSSSASPMNQYALEGIPGPEAEEWSKAKFNAKAAAAWRELRVEPWDAYHIKRSGVDVDGAAQLCSAGLDPVGFAHYADEIPIEVAIAYRREGVDLDDAVELFSDGVKPRDVTAWLRHGLHPLDWIQTGLAPDEALEWVPALEENDLLDPGECGQLHRAGVLPHEAAGSDLTARELLYLFHGRWVERKPDGSVVLRHDSSYDPSARWSEIRTERDESGAVGDSLDDDDLSSAAELTRLDDEQEWDAAGPHDRYGFDRRYDE